MARFNPANADRLISEERRQMMDPDALVARLGIRRGDTLADIGCGPGFFTVPLARACAPGEVWGIDVQLAMIEKAHAYAAGHHVPNARFAHIHEDAALPFEDGQLDGIFCAFAFHEMPDGSATLATWRRKLRPDGWLCLIEWHRQPTPFGPPLDERLGDADTRRMLAAAGFTERASWEPNEHNYALVAVRPEQ